MNKYLHPRARSTCLRICVLAAVCSSGQTFAQDYTIPGVTAWSVAKGTGFTFGPLAQVTGQWVTNPRDGVNTRLLVKQGQVPFQQTVTLGQIIGGNASVSRPGSGTRTVTFEFFGGRRLAPGWTIVRVELAGRFAWDRQVVSGSSDARFRVRATSSASSSGSAIIKTIVLRGPNNANPSDAFFPTRNGRLKLAAPFTYPLAFGPPIGVDHDTVNRENDALCSSYQNRPFPACYDQHTGTDFLMAGGTITMDLGSIEVKAAAPGFVIDVGDGAYDRCHADILNQTINCDGNLGRSQDANFVKVRQDDGLEAWYWHLKNGSVSVQEGQRVKCGTTLGKVGSSGVSAAPHLHFELRQGSRVIDPYPEGLWLSRTILNVPDAKCPF